MRQFFAPLLLHVALHISSCSAKGLFYNPESPPPVPQCPEACAVSGGDGFHWTRYGSDLQVEACDQTVIFYMMLDNTVDDPDADSSIRACSLPTPSQKSKRGFGHVRHHLGLHGRQAFAYEGTNATSGASTNTTSTPAVNITSEAACFEKVAQPQMANLPFRMGWGGQSTIEPVSHRAAAVAEQLADFIRSDISCQASILFARAGSAVLGIHVGSQVDKKTAASAIKQHFARQALAAPGTTSTQVAAEVCGGPQGEGGVASQTLGIFADMMGNTAAVQGAVRKWNSGSCVVSGLGGGDKVSSVELGFLPGAIYAPPKVSKRSGLVRRADCRTAKVQPGSGCWQVAQDCNISQDDLVRFNGGDAKFCNTLQPGQQACCSAGTLPKPVDPSPPANADGTCKYTRVEDGDSCWAMSQRCGTGLTTDDLVRNNGGATTFCNTLQPGQYVCCGKGKIPDFSPKQNADGSCFRYTTVANDNCAKIAASNQIKDWKVLEDFNKNTWGWATCPNLQPKMAMCLSKGDPPMPNPDPNARCGPTVVGTARPSRGASLAELNPCPLSVCCNVWGNCGLDNDFCVPAPIPGGGPGSARPGSHGCVASCGMNITNNAVPPAKFLTIGYFEAWNVDSRECLHMDISRMTDPEVHPPGAAASKYSHVHFAFPNITHDTMEVEVAAFADQFEGLKKLRGIKRILSFGGWAFSNDAGTYAIFRDVIGSEANRDRAARNIVNFVAEHGLDGVDFDWEYPGATDIPGTPPGPDAANEGPNYFKFLKLVRERMPRDKSLSIAAPSSFWYLKNFPIKEMAALLDYIVVMTYDLHGQWDVGNNSTSPGCLGGNCLRSHINMTETMLSLAMYTKAGVPANKVVVGMPFYGRSFKMSQPGCTGPMCTFTGDRYNSEAAKGPCTDTAGYISNYEINQILASVANADLYGPRSIVQYEGDLDDVLVYDDTEWVSWLTPKNYALRSSKWQSLNFGGTSDWAVDLVRSYPDGGRSGPGGMDDGWAASTGPVCDWSRTFGTLEDLERSAGGMSLYCRQANALSVLQSMLAGGMARYNDVNNGYDDKFDDYLRYMDAAIPAVLDKFMIEGGRDGLRYFDCIWDRMFNQPSEGRCGDYAVDRFNQGTYSLEFRLRDRQGFFAQLAKDYGIPEDWVDFSGSKDDTGFCMPSEGAFTICSPDTGTRKWSGYPTKRAGIVMPNPKDVITGTIGNLEDLSRSLLAIKLEVMLGLYSGSIEDVVQVMSVPVFLLLQTVDGMAEVKRLGEEQEKREAEARKSFIIAIVGAVLFVIPFIGQQAAMAVGLTGLARAVFMFGETANLAYGVYTIVDDPSSALMGVMGLLFGIGGLGKVAKDSRGFRDMAMRRAELRSGGSVAKLGAGFKARDDMLQKIVASCVRGR